MSENSSPTIASLEGMLNRAKSYLNHEFAPNTLLAYQKDWEHFQQFCTSLSTESLPAELPTILAYLSNLADSGFKVSTIQRRLSAISKWQEVHGYERPNQHPLVKRLLKSIKRRLGTASKQSKAALTLHIQKCLSSIDITSKRGLRDKALLLLGFVGAFRRSELVSLQIEDLSFDANGLTVYLRKSKTDQEQEGSLKAIPYSSDPNLCPVRTLQHYLSFLNTQGPLFVSILKGDRVQDRPLHASGRDVDRLVKQYLGKEFSAHSLRVGFVTQAKLNQADDHSIMSQTGHRSSTMLHRYTQIVNIWENNASTKLGL